MFEGDQFRRNFCEELHVKYKSDDREQQTGVTNANQKRDIITRVGQHRKLESLNRVVDQLIVEYSDSDEIIVKNNARVEYEDF